MTKRYVLLEADWEVSEGDRKALAAVLEKECGSVKVIGIEGIPTAVIIKTTDRGARLLRDKGRVLAADGRELRTLLSSGAIGNLKRRAREAGANGEVHE